MPDSVRRPAVVRGHRPRHCLINRTSTASKPATITSCATVLSSPVPLTPTSVPAGRHGLGKLRVVRLTEFRALMTAHFGPLRAPSVAKDHVFAALGDRSVDQALEAGISPKRVWAQVCVDFDVPRAMHHGLPD